MRQDGRRERIYWVRDLGFLKDCRLKQPPVFFTLLSYFIRVVIPLRSTAPWQVLAALIPTEGFVQVLLNL